MTMLSSDQNPLEPITAAHLPSIADANTGEPQRSEEAEAIVQEIVEAMTLRLASAGKVFAMGALDEWRANLHRQVKEQLKSRQWETDRETVLAVATDMASIAIILAYKGEVDKDRVDAAFEATKFHRRCPARRAIRPPGLGMAFYRAGCWCDCFPPPPTD